MEAIIAYLLFMLYPMILLLMISNYSLLIHINDRKIADDKVRRFLDNLNIPLNMIISALYDEPFISIREREDNRLLNRNRRILNIMVGVVIVVLATGSRNSEGFEQILILFSAIMLSILLYFANRFGSNL